MRTDTHSLPPDAVSRSPDGITRWLPARSTVVALAALLLYLAAGPAPEALVLERAAALSGQPWGLVTGHLTHADPGHLLWDVLGLLLVGLVYEPLLGRRIWLVLGAGLLTIDGAFLWLLTGFDAYCGLSGLINAVVGGGLIAAVRAGDRWAIGFGLLIVAKVLTEGLTGGGLFTAAAWPTMHGAHAAGLLGGVGAILAANTIRKETTRAGRSPLVTGPSRWQHPRLHSAGAPRQPARCAADQTP